MSNREFLKAAQKYEKQMVKFLRDMVAIPSESAEEGPSHCADQTGDGGDRRVR